MPQRSEMNVETLPGGVGIREDQLHPGAGLRVESVSLRATARENWLLAAVALTDQSTFTELTIGVLAQKWLPYPTTLKMVFRSADGTFGQTIQLRITGLDQFGQAQREVTPLLTITDKSPSVFANTHIWMSKVFSKVDKIEFLGDGMVPTNETLDVGFHTMIATGEVATIPTDNFIHSTANLFNSGFGVPFHLRGYIFDTVAAIIASDFGVRDILGGVMENITNSEEYLILPFNGEGLVAGFLIGTSAKDDPWQGDVDKVSCIEFTGANPWVQSGALGVITAVGWQDEWRVNLTLRTTVGSGHSEPAPYPEVSLSRSVSQ